MPISQYVLYSVDPFVNQKQMEAMDRVDDWLRYMGMEQSLGLATYLRLDRGSTREDIERAAQLPFISSLEIGTGCPITNAQFLALNTSWLATLTCNEGTGLTAEAFANVDFARLQNLFLSGPNFGDEVLERLGNVPWLAVISLEGTRVTAEGLKNIDTTGPLYHLLLPDTQVDDDVFAVLTKHQRLRLVNLSRTQVTGSGLRNFRHDLYALMLDGTPFDSRYLDDMLPPAGEEMTPWNSLSVRRLSINNTNFGGDLFENLKKLKDSVDYLDVYGSDLTLDQLQQLGKSGYGVDALLLDPENVIDFGRADLIYHYDAREMTAEEIAIHFSSIEGARDRAKLLPNGSYAQLVVHHFDLTRSGLIRLKKLVEAQPMNIELRNASTPDGKTKTFPYIQLVEQEYPELGVNLALPFQ